MDHRSLIMLTRNIRTICINKQVSLAQITSTFHAGGTSDTFSSWSFFSFHGSRRATSMLLLTLQHWIQHLTWAYNITNWTLEDYQYKVQAESMIHCGVDLVRLWAQFKNKAPCRLVVVLYADSDIALLFTYLHFSCTPCSPTRMSYSGRVMHCVIRHKLSRIGLRSILEISDKWNNHISQIWGGSTWY